MQIHALAISIALLATTAYADTIANFTLNTATLTTKSAGPFSLDFQLNGTDGNTATLSGFSFGPSGAAVGSPTLIGGASGNLSSSIKLTESGFLNDFTQQFTPGLMLAFELDITTKTKAGFPDEFTFAILDSTGSELPTRGFGDVFVTVDITGSQPRVQTFSSDPSRSPRAGGPALDIPAPSVNQVSAVPEPASLTIFAVGAALVAYGLRCRATGTA
jgi:hypothetical protein